MKTTVQEERVALSYQNINELVGLQTNQSSQRLNQIDRVRARGVSNHISLPQLIICGDQSVGKSSVLKKITNISFSRQESVCTRFATEIILQHQPDAGQITAKIFPSAYRSEDNQLRMASFKQRLIGFDDLPQVIKKASALMRIRESTDIDSNSLTFAADVLCLKVVKDIDLHLTMINLSRLIFIFENPGDMQIVENLVNSYLESS
jgi:hypothetical protein